MDRQQRRKEVRRGARVGDFVIRRPIAAGGCGVVFSAVHAETAKPAALKVLHPELASNRDAVTRFQREILATASIRHRSVVEIYQVGELPSGRPFFAMEYLQGIDLAARLAAEGAMTPAQVLPVLEPLCAALALAHAGDVIHRDVKASNVFLAPQRVVLLDFGVAKLLRLDDSLTQQRLVGTPSCTAPEQIACHKIDARTDVYALGALTHHMLTGKLAYSAATLSHLQYMHMHAARPRPSALAPAATAFDALVATAMAIDPGARYPGPLPFLAAFKAALGHAPAETAAERLAVVVEAGGGDADSLAGALAESDSVLAGLGFRPVLDTSTTLIRVRDSADDPDTLPALQRLAERLAPTGSVRMARTTAGDAALIDAVSDGGVWLKLELV